MIDNDIYVKASKKVKARKDFVISLITWIAFSFFFIYLDTGLHTFRITWAFYPIFFWGLGVLFQAIKVYDFFGLSEKWEREEIRKEIEKRRQIKDDLTLAERDELDLVDIKLRDKKYSDNDLV